MQPNYTLRASGSRVEDFTRQVKLDDLVRQPVNLSLTAENPADGTGDLVIGAGAQIEADPKANITLKAAHLLDIEGRITAPGGTITATLDHRHDFNFDPRNSLWLGKQAVLDVSGVALTYLDNQRLTQGTVLNGGTITLNALLGSVVAEAGSSIRMAGVAPVRLDILNQAGGVGQWVGSDAGSLNIAAREGVLLDAGIAAQGGSANNRSGTFNLVLGDNLTPPVELGFPAGERVLSLAQAVAPQTGGLTPGAAIPAGLNGQARLDAGTLEGAGFDRITLKSHDAIRLENGLNLGANRALPLKEVALDAPRIETTGGDAALKAETLRLGNYDVNRVDVINTPVAGSGALKADAQLLELAGNLTLTGMARAELNGAEEIRLSGISSSSSARPAGILSSAADLLFHGAVVAPATYSQIGIQAPGQTVAFSSDTGRPLQPLSALGSLAVTAANILQNGNVWAPFGQLNFNASDTLTFKSGSLTSIAAAQGNMIGSLIPFGMTVNGRSWIFKPDSFEIPQLALPEKSIRIEAANVDMQPGATVQLTGGGDLQAYEFSVGPGGARDILNDPGTYAILPGYASRFAPGDRQENTSFDRAAGDAVYLSGIPGLPAGVYTLLPAHYALLPGAYAVRLNADVHNLLPGQAYSRQDGIQVVPGYVTDSRAASGGPRDALWSGFEVLTREQVLQRSEINFTRASDFFATSQSRPQDAGLLSIATDGGLKLDAIFRLAAAEGGRGAAVDISAKKIAITSGSPAGIDPLATRIEAATLDAMGAASLFLGGTRSPGSTRSDATILTVGADEVTLANDAAHALKSGEIILAAKNTLTLKSGTAIDAQGSMDNADGAGSYTTAGNGALVRAASTYAAFSRTDSPDRTEGTLTGEAGSTIRASNSITLDATKQNTFAGTTIFADAKGNPVAGNLSVGATRVNFGSATAGAEGLILDQSELDRLNSLNSLTLTSYSTFDLYGDVSVGGVSDVSAGGKPTLQALNLLGAGFAGLNNGGQTAHVRAASILISNPAAAAFTPGGVLGTGAGSGALAIQADRLVLGEGAKAIQGFSRVDVTANELIGRGTGSIDVGAGTNLAIARISGEQSASQTLTAAGQLDVANMIADRTLAAVNALGAKWTLSGTGVMFDTQASLPSGALKLTAATGNLELGTNAELNVTGRPVTFFDVSRPSPGGTVELASGNGNVVVQTGARVNVSAAAGGDAGRVIIRAPNGTATLAAASLLGSATADAGGAGGTGSTRGEGGRFELDVASLNDFSTLNRVLNQGVFDGARTLRARTGDVSVAADDSIKAKTIRISADGGRLDVAGHIDASGNEAGSIGLYAKNDVAVVAGAKLDAYATGDGKHGGEVEIGTAAGRLNLAQGSTLDVHGGGSQAAQGGEVGEVGEGGKVLLRAPRTGSGAGNDVAVDSVASSIGGAKSVVVEAVKVYDNITTLTDTGASSGATLSLATVNADNASFASSAGAIAARLGKTGDTGFHVRAGVEVRSAGNLTLSKDWNLGTSRAGGEPGMLTLRAAGNLNLNSNLSDGFNVATAFSSGTTPATLLAGDSWGYRLVAGSDSGAADPMTVKAGSGDVTLAAGKLVRTGTGDIHVASGHNIKLADGKSAIYTAGRIADTVAGFVVPANAQFSQGGGSISLTALGDISGLPSAQLYSNWLFRQGQLNQTSGAYTVQPAWWVRFDQFQQGIGALGGGDVTLTAGGNVVNISASTPAQARMAAMAPDASKLVKTGGGNVRVETGGDLRGGQYYADSGDLVLIAGGKFDSGRSVNGSPLYPILALGDAQARIQAQGDIDIQTVLNPHLIVQSSGTGTSFNIGTGTNGGVRDPRWSLFSTYGQNSGVHLQSLGGNVTLHSTVGENARVQDAYGSPLNFNISTQRYKTALLSILPPSLSATAFQGSASIQGGENITLSPAPRADLTLLAANSVSIAKLLIMSDRDPALIPNAVRPDTGFNLFPTAAVNPADINLVHAAVPVHTGDTLPARIYAVAGNVQGDFNTLTLDLSKSVQVRAGQDVRDLGIQAQHVSAGDVSRVQAGRDVTFTSGNDRTDNAKIWVGGPGRLEVIAGRNIDLGTSAGIVSRGDLDNAQLPRGGADIHVAAGVGALGNQGIDYTGAIDRLIAELEAAGNNASDALLWQARWLTGNDALNGSSALQAVKAVRALDADTQRVMVREMVYTALLTTGRDYNDRNSPYAGNYDRGYAALELLFPGLREKNPDGSFRNYQGEINLFASRIKTERGGSIEFMAPGGEVIVGLSNTPAVLVNTGNDVLGMLTVADGNIRGFSRDSILVNQSRILTVGGGNMLLWSSEGDIDAGKGKKTATAVPPPVVKVNAATGQVTQELQGAAAGSGIGALSTGGIKAGDIDLIAPRGAVNAGDAGIRAGNLNIAAQVVLGANNISVAGTSTGTPVADASAVSATTSGATSQGDDVSKTTAALSQNLSDAARTSDETRKLKPTFISTEVIGHGE
ncbi:MAG TPA: filamentous hemagglutinin family protein [Nitrosospira sp.]